LTKSGFSDIFFYLFSKVGKRRKEERTLKSTCFTAIFIALSSLIGCDIGHSTYDQDYLNSHVGGSSSTLATTNASSSTGGKTVTYGSDACREGIPCRVSGGSTSIATTSGTSMDIGSGGSSVAQATTGGASTQDIATGGASTADYSTGGVLATGGSNATGGAIATGGASTQDIATGGGSSADFASGGTSAAEATGGASTIDLATGGASSATGGQGATGGASTADLATGGASTVDVATGGTPSTGGQPSTGGMPATGGMAATGGSSSTGGCGQEFKLYITQKSGSLNQPTTHCVNPVTKEEVEAACDGGIYCYFEIRSFIPEEEWLCYISTGNANMPRLPAKQSSNGACYSPWGTYPLITTQEHYALYDEDWSVKQDENGECVYSLIVNPDCYYGAGVCL
jgi:hypothetical protein